MNRLNIIQDQHGHMDFLSFLNFYITYFLPSQNVSSVDITTATRPSQLFMFYSQKKKHVLLLYLDYVPFFSSFLLFTDRSLLNWGLFCVVVPHPRNWTCRCLRSYEFNVYVINSYPLQLILDFFNEN